MIITTERSHLKKGLASKIWKLKNYLEKTLKEVKKHKFELVITSLQTENSIYDVDYNKKVIVIKYKI